MQQTPAQQTVTPPSDGRPLPLSLCIGWGLGTLGIAIMFNSTNILILRYMTDQLGIAAAVGGALVGASKIFDAGMDPVIGGVSDRTTTRIGRRRPFLLAGAILCGIVMVLMYNGPILEPRLAAIYMGVILIMFAGAYATFNVPYLAMPAEMTDSYHERSYLMSFRVFAVSIGQSLGGYIGPKILASQADRATGYHVMGWSLGIMTLVACLTCFAMTRRARFTNRDAGIHMPVWQQFKLAAGNKPFRMLMGTKLCQLTSLAIVQASLGYYTFRVLRASDSALGNLTLLQTVSILISIPLWVRISRRLGKRNAYLCAALLYGAIMSTWLIGDATLSLAYIRYFCSGFGVSGILLMGSSMLPDTIEFDFRRTGMRREGIFSGVYTTIEKVSFALGVTILGLFLGAMGYIQSAGGNVEQPQSALTAVYICIGVVPITAMTLSCFFLWNYDLSETRLKTQQVVTS